MSDVDNAAPGSRPLSGQRFVRATSSPPELLADGVNRQILGHGDDLMMVSVEFEAGAVGAVHRHVHRQVTYVASGRFEVMVNGERQVLEAGDSFYVAADLDHGVRALTAGILVDVFTPARQEFLSES